MTKDEIHVLRIKLEHAICVWDRKQKNFYAGALALQRLDSVMAEIADGTSVARALYDGFNDRLCTALEKAAGVPVTFKGGSKDTGRPL